LKTIISVANDSSKTVLYDKSLNSNAMKVYLIMSQLYKKQKYYIYNNLWNLLKDIANISGSTLAAAFNCLHRNGYIQYGRTKKCKKIILN